jgi:hypothetical protein
LGAVSVTDLLCDVCGTALVGPAVPDAHDGPRAVRFMYHPGEFRLKDDSGLVCADCWAAIASRLGDRHSDRCCRCSEPVTTRQALHWHRAGDPEPWLLCRRHAAELLNTLRTVEPKLDPDTMLFAADWRSR